LVRNFFLVGTGGFLGSVCRYYIGALVTSGAAAPRFPLGTLVVNVTGCFLIGLLAGLAETAHMFSPAARLFLLTGFLGGYTTFSAFAYVTYFLGREHAWAGAALNIGTSVTLGLLALVIGHRLAAAFGT